MCFICDGGTHDEYDAVVAANMKKFGWHLTGVEASRGSPGCVDTIGLIERFDHPELIVMGGCCMQCGAAHLNDLGRLIEAGTSCTVDSAVCAGHPGGPARFGPVHAGHWSNRLGTWMNYYKPRGMPFEPAALQVITQDLSGAWQDEVSSWRHLRLDRPPLRHARHPR